ncbi:MAG: glycosyltransferase family 4 protein, partial [Planctomycetota bacterium]
RNHKTTDDASVSTSSHYANPKATDRPRVGFLCAGDPLDPEFFSGTLFNMYHALADAGADVHPIGRDAVKQTKLKRLKRKIMFKLKGKGVNWTSGQAGNQARAIAKDMAALTPDVVFAPVASGLIGRWTYDDVPVVHASDATPKLLFGYYDRYSGPDAMKRFEASDTDERLAIAKAAATVVSSDWARDSVIADYGAAPESVHVVPLGANVKGALTPDEVQARPTEGALHLLFIGAAWERKGGAFALEAAKTLHERGLDVVLHLVGSRPPGNEALPDYVVDEGWCDKRDPADAAKLDGLLRKCHVFVLPTRADCTPVSINEAHAYGMPAVATDTGGVGSVLEAGVTGALVPLEADGKAWADAIGELWTDRAAYSAMARAAQQRYATALSWPAWGRTTAAVLRGVAKVRESHAAVPRG